jgi:ligand-binding sensor domain-containing protein/signal transduction histidine kinase
MMKKLLSWMAALLLPVGVAVGAGQPVNDMPFSEDYVLRTWEVTEGLRDNHISSIARSSDGYLWVTNFSGLFRFDGDRFVRMDAESMPGLPSRWVSPVFTARDQSLWLGLERGGIARWHEGRVDTLAPIQPRPTSEVWPTSFAEDNAGAVWYGDTNEPRASRFSNGQMVSYSTADGIPAGTRTMVRVTMDGKVWVATSGGCALFDGRRFDPVDPGAGGAMRLMLAPSRAGGMWTIRGGKLLRYGSLGERLETIQAGWLQESEQINVLLEDHTGALWIGTRDFGLLRFQDGQFSRVRTSYGDISSLTEDREGNLWAGTWGGGLNRLSPRHFFLWPTQPGALSNLVESVCEGPEDKLWFLNRDGSPARANEPGGHTFSSIPGWPADVYTNVLCDDRKGGIWLGTTDGLMQWQNGALHGTPFREATDALFMDREGTLWIGTDSGALFSYRDGHAEKEDGAAGARAMAEDWSGCLWVGTEHGTVFRRHNGQFARVELPGAGADESVRFIVPDGKDTVWIGTLLGGIYRWRDGQVQRLPADAGVSLAEVRSLLIERTGTGHDAGYSTDGDVFWVGTATGLLRASREDLEGYMDGRLATLRMFPCGSNEGLPNAEFMEETLNTAVQTRDGHLWFATNRGLLEIQPRAAPESPSSAQVKIEEASVGSLFFRSGIAKDWVFPPRPGVLRIRYTLPELRMPDQVRFRYRLGGRAGYGQWIDVENQREATIIDPEPGKYQFEVAGAVGDGPWLSPPAVVDFTVRPARWQTATFRWGVVVAAVVFIAIGGREIATRRMRARIRRLEQEGAVERERGRIARDMHDELGANLTHISASMRLAALEPAEAVGEHLREIAAVARQTVESLDEIVWAVNPRNDTLAGTVEYIGKFAVRFLASAGVGVEIDLPHTPPAMQISAEVRHHLFLAVKEAINNVVTHSGASSARLEVRIASGSLEVTVADDGHGFAPGTEDGFSNGLVNMRERMAGIGGRCRVESRPGTGSCVTFDVPLSGGPREPGSA